MREIKFRAWDNDLKMSRHFKIGEIPTWDTRDGQITFSRFRWAWDVMQYTGLKDKNGVEIYEGDILKGKHYTDTDEYLEIVWHLGDWEGPMWGAKLLRDSGHYPLSGHKKGWIFGNIIAAIDTSKGVVIGNIYENKELLDA